MDAEAVATALAGLTYEQAYRLFVTDCAACGGTGCDACQHTGQQGTPLLVALADALQRYQWWLSRQESPQ